MTLHFIIGLCATLSGILSGITGAIPSKYAVWILVFGFIITAVDRAATALEGSSTKVPVSTPKEKVS